MTELIDRFVGVFIGGLISWPVVFWIGQRYSQYYALPSVAQRGGIMYVYLMVLFIGLPAISLLDMLDFSGFQFLLPIFMGGMFGLVAGLLISLFIRFGAHARLPLIGRSLNAFLLALARANRDKIDKQVKKYEEIDASFAKA